MAHDIFPIVASFWLASPRNDLIPAAGAGLALVETTADPREFRVRVGLTESRARTHLTVRLILTVEAGMAEPTRKMPKEEAKARRQAERQIGRKLPKTLHCSFCGKGQHQVQKLIAGPRGVFICNECVGLCNDVIAERPIPSGGFQPLLDRSTEELIVLLPSISFATEANRDFLQALVDRLREREVSWAAIAEPLGVSRQSAWERFS